MFLHPRMKKQVDFNEKGKDKEIPQKLTNFSFDKLSGVLLYIMIEGVKNFVNLVKIGVIEVEAALLINPMTFRFFGDVLFKIKGEIGFSPVLHFIH